MQRASALNEAEQTSIRQRVVQVICNTRGCFREECINSARLLNDLEFESIDILEMSTLIEFEFDFSPGFPTSGLEYLLDDLSDHDPRYYPSKFASFEPDKFVQCGERLFGIALPDSVIALIRRREPEKAARKLREELTVGFIVKYVTGRLRSKTTSS
jgi:acyl carrier protein